MSEQPETLYDIGDLKSNTVKLYDLAVMFSAFFDSFPEDSTLELWHVLLRVQESLWSNLPPVVVIDFRDPDDPNTWGEFGKPPDLPTIAR